MPKAMTRKPASTQQLGGRRGRRDARAEEADDREGVRGEAELAEDERDGHRDEADAVAELGADERAAAHADGAPWPSRARSRARCASNDSGTSEQTVSRPLRRVVTMPAARSLPRCQLTSGWESPTWSMSSVTVAAPAGQALDDAQAVDVGEGLVEVAQLAQVIGLVDDRGDRRADAGGRGGQGVELRYQSGFI